MNKIDTKLMAPRNGIEMRINSLCRLLPNRDHRGDSHKHLLCTFADKIDDSVPQSVSELSSLKSVDLR